MSAADGNDHTSFLALVQRWFARHGFDLTGSKPPPDFLSFGEIWRWAEGTVAAQVMFGDIPPMLVRVPVPSGRKGPVIERWQQESPFRLLFVLERLEKKGIAHNVGIRLDGMTVVDCDSSQAVAWWLENAPETTYQSTARDPDERRTFWYRDGYENPGPFSVPGGTDHDGEVKSGNGHQVLVATSIHPVLGRPYRWLGPELTDPDQPPPVPVDLIDRLRPGRHSGRSRERNWAGTGIACIGEGYRDSFLTSMGGLGRRWGLTEEAMAKVLSVINIEVCHPPLPDSDIERIARSVANFEPEGGVVLLDANDLAEQIALREVGL